MIQRQSWRADRAYARRRKKTTLVNLDITHEQLRMQMHLANELGYLGYKDGRKNVEEIGLQAAHRYIAISTKIDELGRMIGGWMHTQSFKYIKENNHDLYLLQRGVSAEFDARTLNVVKDATPIMERILGAAAATRR
jgi:hypothetical protein